MHICFHTPFKPLGFPTPSGDLTIAEGLCGFLRRRGHRIWTVPSTRTRWIYWRPRRWFAVMRDGVRSIRYIRAHQPDVWLTYHAYYKSPDILGPMVTRRTHLPYVIFQGMYSTRRRKQLKTRPGFIWNRRSLDLAEHVFTNRRDDLINLRRLLPDDRVTYARPGIYPEDFSFSPRARADLRDAWQVGDRCVIVSAAMFRPGVKTEGIRWVIRVCARLAGAGTPVRLVIAGDGRERENLQRFAHDILPGRVRFVGKIPRNRMHQFYSAGDVFAFPGIRESLGMVYLEAQSCGLPVAAFLNGGVPEVVRDRETGFLVPPFDMEAYQTALNRLVTDDPLRRRMGRNARDYVRAHHDLNVNYGRVETILSDIVRKRKA